MPKKIRVIIVIPAAILGILALINEKYYWLLNLSLILMSLNLIIMGFQEFKENKKSPFAYIITALAILIIFLSLNKLFT